MGDRGSGSRTPGTHLCIGHMLARLISCRSDLLSPSGAVPDEQRKSRGARSFLRCAGRAHFGALQPAGLQAIFASERGEDAVGEVGLAGGFPSPYIAILLGTETA